jgi:tripartite-type tricarboxylate transporter receptor subunit TctC
MSRRKIMKRIAAVVFALAAGAAGAQSFPTKPIRIVVPYPPGGSTDLVSRLAAAKMGPALGQAVIVENRAGGNAIIGTELVSRSAPDGYTTLFTTPATHTQVQYTMKSVPYDALRDFTPITAAVLQSSALMVHPSVPVTSFREFLDYAKRNPGKLSYGTPNVASNFHLAGELIKQMTGIDMVHVPYKGGGPTQQAIIAGEVGVAIMSNTSATAPYKAGKVRVLAVLDGRRLKDWPDIPSVREFLPEFEKPGEWLGFYGPAKLQRPVADRLRNEFLRAMKEPDVAAKLDAFGLEYFGNTPEEFVELIRRDMALNQRLLQLAGVKPE